MAIGAVAGMGLFGGDGGSDSWLPLSSNSSYADTQFQDSVIPDDSADNLNDNQTLNKTENKSAELENKTNSNNITKNTTKENNTNSSKYFVKNTTDKVKNITKDSGKNSSQNTVKDTNKNKNKNTTKSDDKSKTTSSSKSSQDKSDKNDKSEKSSLKSNNQPSSIIIKTNDNDLDDDLDDDNGLDDFDKDDEDNDNDDGLDDDANDADKDEDSLSSSNALKMTDVPNLAKEASDRDYDFNSISFNGNQLTKAQCIDIFSKYILNIDSNSDSDIEIRDIDDASNPSGEDSSQSISKSDYLSIADRVSSCIDKKDQVPNYVGVSTIGQADLSPDKMLELFGQVILEYSITEELPSSVEI